jgi:hypothetical protein
MRTGVGGGEGEARHVPPKLNKILKFKKIHKILIS